MPTVDCPAARPRAPRAARLTTRPRGVIVPAVLLPLLIILAGVAASVAVAWGADPSLAERSGGLAFVCVMHRLQWLMIGVAVLSGLTLTALVVFGRRRAWWLIGLMPVVGLFGWRFAAVGTERSLWVEDQPAFASAAQARWLDADDPVIGVVIDGQGYAYPLAALGRAPVVVMNDRERRLMLAWSAGANTATAAWIDRTVRGRDLEVVCAPAGVLLIYNRRLGEFFDAMLLRTPVDRCAPHGLLGRVTTARATWDQWRTEHPETMVLQPRWSPSDPPPPPPDAGPTLLWTDPPIVVTRPIDADPRNLSSGGMATAVVFRDQRGAVRAFDRRVDGDLFLQFMLKLDRKTQRKSLVDGDTGSTWTPDGLATAGPLKGKRLREIDAHASVSAAAIKFWAPDAKVVE